MKNAPLILRIKRGSLDDGPGLRTSVFFKGCPLSCKWCHNPEARLPVAELSYDESRCIGCGTCETVCPRRALGKGIPNFSDRVKCERCFKCVQTCPPRALTRVGEVMSIEEILFEIEKDVPFFKTSGGGVTLTGGEPTLHLEFASELASHLKERGIHVLLETSGQFEFEAFHRMLYPHLDSIFFDLKLIDSEKHRAFCNIGNERILTNFRYLATLAAKGGVPILPRIPLIPGVTDTKENLSGLAYFISNLGVKSLALLPYNPTWHNKAGMIGRVAEFTEDKWMTPEHIEHCRGYFRGFKLAD